MSLLPRPHLRGAGSGNKEMRVAPSDPNNRRVLELGPAFGVSLK